MARLAPRAALGVLCFALLGCGESPLPPVPQDRSGSASVDDGRADASTNETMAAIDVHPTPDSAAGVCPQTAPASKSPCTPVGLECTGYVTPIVSCRCTERPHSQPVWACIALLY